MPDETESPVVEVLTGKEITTTVPQFVAIADQLTALRAAYQDVEPDMSTVETRAATTENWRKFRNVRLALDKAKPAAKGDLQEKLKAIEADYKSIHAVLSEFESKYGNAIDEYENARKAEKAAEQKREDDRRALIIDNMNRIAAIPSTAVGLNSAELQDLVEKTVALPITGPEFQEFLSKAESVRADALRQLREMLAKVIEQEAVAVRLREEIEALEKKQANERRIEVIKQNIQAIQNYKLHALAWDIPELEKFISQAENQRITGDQYHEFVQEAHDALTVALADLHGILSDKKVAARIAEEQAAAIAERTRLNEEAAAKLRKEREEFEAQQAEARRIAKEAADKAAAEEAERQRAIREAEEQAAAKLAEEKRLLEEKEAAEKAEAEKQEAERKRLEAEAETARLIKANEKAAAEQAKKLKDPLEALRTIHAITQDPGTVATLAIRRIAVISEKFIPKENELELH